jgi:hypothetical protein
VPRELLYIFEGISPMTLTGHIFLRHLRPPMYSDTFDIYMCIYIFLCLMDYIYLQMYLHVRVCAFSYMCAICQSNT